jgi:beta-N-acetylhexosaminidase
MKRIEKKTLLISLILLVLVVSTFKIFINRKRISKGQPQLENLTASEMLNKMTLEDKIGQMLMVGFWGEEPDYYINKMIDERNVGGVVLLNYNLKNKEQTIKLVDSLQNRSLKTGLGIPLLISTDQEGGAVSRVEFLDTENVPQSEIRSVEDAYSIANKRAVELKKLGIYVNYSPVLDHITNPENFLFKRTFSVKLDQIGELGSQMIKGYYDGGIVSVPKHFPGHTDSSPDSHNELPKSNLEKEELKKRIKPFEEVINKVEPKVIMVGHILYSKIDSQPASLSGVFIEGLLRGDLEFKGLVITDDMEMGAILDNYSVAESAVEAVKAGNDILLYSSTPEKQVEAYEAIIEAVNSKEISHERIDRSVLKILKLKKEFYY